MNNKCHNLCGTCSDTCANYYLNDRELCLENIIKDTLWMARRYADGRRTYAVSMVNDAIDKCNELGIEIKEDHTLINGNKYATDADFGQ